MDIDKSIQINRLLDTYGELLTIKQLQICKYYFFENLTLAEIGEILEISRQAVNDCIEKSTKMLYMFESKVGKLKLIDDMRGELEKLKNLSDKDNLTEEVEKILDKLD